MVIIVNSNIKKSDIKKIFSKVKSKNTFKTKNHAGKINLKLDPLEIQKKLRSEWE
ncbi:MAG: hypothetical protein RLZZ546_1193 [Bacteroidota bacterium]|jgi:hypothetical protein